MCITFSPLGIEKKEAMEMSYPVLEDDISVMIPYPKRQTDKLGILLAPFQTKVHAKYYSQNLPLYTYDSFRN